jgi:hypothetical protein
VPRVHRRATVAEEDDLTAVAQRLHDGPGDLHHLVEHPVLGHRLLDGDRVAQPAAHEIKSG